MVRLVLCICAMMVVATHSDAQQLYKQKKRRSDFLGGPEDYRNLRNYGLQITFGPNYTFSRLKNETVSVTPSSGSRYEYVQDPAGRLGGFLDIGMVHYRMKKPKFLLKKNLIHYLDWGVGFDYIGGREKTTVNYLDPFGNVASTSEGKGKFYNGYVYGRITFHWLLNITDRLHLDYGLGFNGDYALVGKNKDYDGISIPTTQHFQKDFILQVHAQLGLNIRLKRGDYLVPGIWAPALGAYEWNKGKPTIQWYSSNYWPVHFQIKWLHSFVKKSNGCNTGTEEDRKRNEEYMQNR